MRACVYKCAGSVGDAQFIDCSFALRLRFALERYINYARVIITLGFLSIIRVYNYLCFYTRGVRKVSGKLFYSSILYNEILHKYFRKSILLIFT